MMNHIQKIDPTFTTSPSMSFSAAAAEEKVQKVFVSVAAQKWSFVGLKKERVGIFCLAILTLIVAVCMMYRKRIANSPKPEVDDLLKTVKLPLFIEAEMHVGLAKSVLLNLVRKNWAEQGLSADNEQWIKQEMFKLDLGKLNQLNQLLNHLIPVVEKNGEKKLNPDEHFVSQHRALQTLLQQVIQELVV
ncbi:MAG: hypothetical protein JSR58_06820 [Verrucomicrobia bacterium]|nr:hypothetical protein [Verrucomicrobiota bacterium]